jgi:hypothetical protein
MSTELHSIISYGSSVNDIHIASDGFFYPKNENAGHSWIFASWDGEFFCSVPGSSYGNLMTPLRAELLGILSALCI